MAEPNGTQAETHDEKSSVLSTVADGMSYEERSSRAFQALEEGHDPETINREYTKPFPEREETAKGKPEEAAGNKPDRQETKPKDQDGDNPAKDSKDDKPDEKQLEQFLAAKRVLKRDQLSDADIEAIGMDRAIELAASRAEAHAAIDRRFSQPKPEDDQGQDPAPQDTTETPKLDDSHSEIVEQISEFDDELAERVKGLLSGAAEQLQTTQQALAANQFRVTVERVSESYPELKDDGVFNRVLDRAKVLAKSDAYDTADAAFEDAAILVLSPTREARAQDRLLDSNIAARNGQIDSETTVDQDQKPMGQDERDSYGFQLLQKGKNPKEVQSILSKIPWPSE